MSIASAWLVLSILGSILSSYLYKKRAIVFFLFLSSLFVGHFITREHAVSYRMLYLILITFLWIKCIVLVEHNLERNINFSLKKRLLFIFAWVGMNPSTFFNKSPYLLEDTKVILRRSVFFLGLGIALMLIVNKTGPHTTLSVQSKWIISYLSLFAISCILHFGFIPLNTVIIRKLGYPAPTFFINPFRAESLAVFWGKGWNIPYADMIETTVFTPLKRYGLATSLIASFAFSGFLHEIAFSVPINEGYGLPTSYFLIQSMLILLERKYLRNRLILKKVLMYLSLFLPLPLLFHPAFMKEVIWPILNFS